jgi:hypothetical protein
MSSCCQQSNKVLTIQKKFNLESFVNCLHNLVIQAFKFLHIDKNFWEVSTFFIGVNKRVTYTERAIHGCRRAQTSQNWCKNVNFSVILITFVYVVPF